MSHGTPWMLWISAKIALPIPSDVEPRRCSGDSQIYNASIVCGGFDCVRSSVLTKSHGTIVGIAGKLLGVEFKVLKGIGRP